MSNYTTPLRAYIEKWTQDTSTMSVADRIETGRTKLFDFSYPIFDESYKKDFETHFIRHFYMREIGFETEGLFKFQLETWLNIHMPYFNQLFKSELLDFDPLKNSSTDVTHHKTNDATQNSSGNSSTTASQTDNAFNRNMVSDTPQDRLAITTEDGSGVIEYASGIEENTQSNTANNSVNSDSSSNSDANATEDFTQHREGKIGVQSYSKMLTEYRDTFIRIEKQIFNEMNELFMLIY